MAREGRSEKITDEDMMTTEYEIAQRRLMESQDSKPEDGLYEMDLSFLRDVERYWNAMEVRNLAVSIDPSNPMRARTALAIAMASR